MKLLDRMPIYKTRRYSQGYRDGVYARLRLNQGGASLYRGAVSLTLELYENIEEFNKESYPELGWAHQIEILVELVYQCWNDVMKCIEVDETIKELVNRLKPYDEVTKKYDHAGDGYYSVECSEDYFAKVLAPELKKELVVLKEQIVKPLLDFIKSLNA